MTSKVSERDRRLNQLEGLVEEMIKETPKESLIKTYMKDIGLSYSADPIQRMSDVLSAIDRIRTLPKPRPPETEQEL